MLRFVMFAVVAGLGLMLFAIAAAVQDPVITRYTVAMPGLQTPVRIVQLSDSHASPVDMPAVRLRRVVAAMNALRPDLIVLTGDYISGYPDRWSAAQMQVALAPFDGLRAPLGVYAVLGNHDDKAATRVALVGARAALAESQVRLLVGERVTVGPLELAGSDDMLRGSPSVETLRRLVRPVPAGRPIVALAHEPDFLQWLPPRNILLITGHTHGGQIRLPLIEPWLLGDYLRAHMRGLYREGGNVLIVSSGLGTSILPMRIGVPPEIVVISLVPAPGKRP